ncbi:MAG: 50S ribosomal protein L3 [bacterium]|nr:50S ribosomal protein L3 [bacterium]
MINTLLGKKIDQSQRFLSSGQRVPITEINVSQNFVVRVKTKEKDKYAALQLGFGMRKHAGKVLLGQIRGASLTTAPQFFREVRLSLAQANQMPKAGDLLRASDIFKPGDIVDVLGISKGKGFAGVVKRHHFKGGPRTHGQSDRERAPGSIGQTTTPGRVYKGKRMAGRMGHERVTIKNLRIVDVSDTALFIKGLVPGPKNSLIMIKKIGEDKKFIPLYKGETEGDQNAS